jgi:hypothetical protein
MRLIAEQQMLGETFARRTSMKRPDRRPKVRINVARFWAGATAAEIVHLVLPDLEPHFELVVSDSPQVVLYGPYTGNMPKGRYTKVFIGCENLRPIMSECDWAFGVEHEDSVCHPRYMRIARWDDDSHFVRRDKDWSEILRGKRRFCVFLYSAHVPYREAFYEALSRYKRVDSPGRAKNNMPVIDPVPGQCDWNVKIDFLRQYKFVVAFESGSRPGYNTEKLTHAIEADCLPIYWGDPEIARSFNVRRFINGHDYLPRPRHFLPRLPYRPHSLRSGQHPTPLQRAARRFNGTASKFEQHVWAARGFDRLVERVIEIDRDDQLYLRHLREPFLMGDRPPDRSRWIARWREIFLQATS